MYKGTDNQVIVFRVVFILDPFFNLSHVGLKRETGRPGERGGEGGEAR